MKLRSHGDSISNQKKSKKISKCHICRVKNPLMKYIICSNTTDCKRGFCYTCIKQHFSVEPHLIDHEHWICFVCRGSCNCSRCKERINDDLKALRAVQEKEQSAEKSDVSDETLVIKEWRKDAMLKYEKEFKGPKNYPKEKERTGNQKPKNQKKIQTNIRKTSKNLGEPDYESERKQENRIQNKKNMKEEKSHNSNEFLIYFCIRKNKSIFEYA